MIVCYAMGNSISIVVGQQLGAGEIEKAKDYDLKMLFMNFVMCLAIGIVLFNVSSLIPQIYNTSLEVKALASQLLKLRHVCYQLFLFIIVVILQCEQEVKLF